MWDIQHFSFPPPQMPLTASTSWRTTGWRPAWWSSPTTATGRPARAWWSAAGRSESPTCRELRPLLELRPLRSCSGKPGDCECAQGLKSTALQAFFFFKFYSICIFLGWGVVFFVCFFFSFCLFVVFFFLLFFEAHLTAETWPISSSGADPVEGGVENT